MSFPKTDRKLRSAYGNDGSATRELGNADFTRAVALALKSEYGDFRPAVKRVALLTGANERAVKNWFDARNAPSGFYLVVLARHSDDVLRLVLALAQREGSFVPLEVAKAREAMVLAVAALDRLPDQDSGKQS